MSDLNEFIDNGLAIEDTGDAYISAKYARLFPKAGVELGVRPDDDWHDETGEFPLVVWFGPRGDFTVSLVRVDAERLVTMLRAALGGTDHE